MRSIPATADAVRGLGMPHSVGSIRACGAHSTHGCVPHAATRLFFTLCIMFLCVSSSLMAQQQKLTPIQQNQLKMYQFINEANKQHKPNPKLFFQKFNEPIATTSQALAKENQNCASKMQEMAEKAADQGQMKRGQLLAQAAGIYHKMAQLALEMGKAYNETNVGGFKKAVDAYLKLENDLRTNSFQVIARPWFSEKECSFYLRSLRK